MCIEIIESFKVSADEKTQGKQRVRNNDGLANKFEYCYGKIKLPWPPKAVLHAEWSLVRMQY